MYLLYLVAYGMTIKIITISYLLPYNKNNVIYTIIKCKNQSRYDIKNY